MNTSTRIRLLEIGHHASDAVELVFHLSNDADPLAHAREIATAARVELHFPSFTDGRAYSQAYLIRRRLGFKGDLRATGDVLADQVLQTERMGFSSAVLGTGIAREDALRQLERFPAFYQSDLVRKTPHRAQ